MFTNIHSCFGKPISLLECWPMLLATGSSEIVNMVSRDLQNPITEI